MEHSTKQSSTWITIQNRVITPHGTFHETELHLDHSTKQGYNTTWNIPHKTSTWITIQNRVITPLGTFHVTEYHLDHCTKQGYNTTGNILQNREKHHLEQIPEKKAEHCMEYST